MRPTGTWAGANDPKSQRPTDHQRPELQRTLYSWVPAEKAWDEAAYKLTSLRCAHVLLRHKVEERSQPSSQLCARYKHQNILQTSCTHVHDAVCGLHVQSDMYVRAWVNSYCNILPEA